MQDFRLNKSIFDIKEPRKEVELDSIPSKRAFAYVGYYACPKCRQVARISYDNSSIGQIRDDHCPWCGRTVSYRIPELAKGAS